jgi:hypothetical protein
MFWVVDLDGTGGPVIVGQTTAANFAFDVTVEGNYAYVAGNPGLCVIDISDPMNPVQRGFVYAPSTARAIDVSGDIACLADMGAGLQVVDVSDPDHPQIVGEAVTQMPAVNVALLSDHAHLTLAEGDNAAFEIYDIADPTAPWKSNWTGVPGSRPWGAAAHGSLVATTYKNHYWEGGAVTFTDVVSERCVPLLGKLNIPGHAFRDLAISGETGCALTSAWAQGGTNFKVLDLSGAPSSITVLGSTNLTPGVCDVEVAGPFAYVSGWVNEQASIFVVDVSDPQAPRQRGWAMLGGQGEPLLATSGSYVYVAPAGVGVEGLVVVDASDPDSPEIVAQLDLQMGQVLGIAIQGSYLYATGAHGFEIIDISSPTNPVHAGGLLLPDYGCGVAVAGGFAYVHEYRSRAPDFVQVIDVANPHAPILRGRATTPAAGARLAISGSFIYMCAGGLLVVDVADPDHPRVVGQAMRNALSGVVVADGTVFGSSEDLLVMAAQCVAAGLDAEARSPVMPELRVSPNPVRESALLHCIVPESGRTRVSVYDVSGRGVRVLHDGVWEPGTHDLIWDGRDGRGHRVAAGFYVARLSADHSRSRSARLVVVR